MERKNGDVDYNAMHSPYEPSAVTMRMDYVLIVLITIKNNGIIEI